MGRRGTASHLLEMVKTKMERCLVKIRPPLRIGWKRASIQWPGERNMVIGCAAAPNMGRETTK
jgi:hypothetical protein